MTKMRSTLRRWLNILPPTRGDTQGHMLERIIYWDRDQAMQFEQDHDVKALTMMPLLEELDSAQMAQIVDKFRLAIKRLKHSDWRRFWADLEGSILRQLVRFTFLHARPVLTWELSFNELG